MAQDDTPFDAEEAAVRSRRMVQISSLVIAGLVIVAVRSVLLHSWETTAVLVGGIGMLLLCQWLNRRGATGPANLVLVLALTVVVALLMWQGEGLRDSALLAFPAVLISAGLLIRPAHFVRLVAAMVLVVIGLVVGTWAGWRQDKLPDDLANRAIDATIILLISGFAVWVMIGDLHRALGRLRLQIAQFLQSQENLTYLSQHDALTGLPNRILGRSKMEQAIAHAQRNGGYVALLFVDLDNFKSINDSLGHSAGDEFLQLVAKRLLESVRQNDVVSRQGGDEFLIGITDMAQGEAVSTVASKILERLGAAFQLRGTEISASCSIGIAVFPDNGTDFETLLRNADISVFHAKDAGRNLFRFYDASMNTQMRQNLHC